MSVRMISPLETVEGARKDLARAALLLAEASVLIAQANERMMVHEHNWRLGWYTQKEGKEAE